MPDRSITRLLLLRHGETSQPDLFHGAESDVGLGQRGHRQAELAGRWLADQAGHALYCSGMRRARETAEIVGRHTGLIPRIVPELHERRMGNLSGRSRGEGESIHDAIRMRWMAGDLDATDPGAESYRQVRDRVAPALREIATVHPGETAIVIAHGLVIRVVVTALVAGFTVADWNQIGIACAAVNDLRFNGSIWTAAALNACIPSDFEF